MSFTEIDDDITRRDSLHATINSLPDPNYATLRALTLVSHSNLDYAYVLSCAKAPDSTSIAYKNTQVPIG